MTLANTRTAIARLWFRAASPRCAGWRWRRFPKISFATFQCVWRPWLLARAV